ncbi:hypothetical protein, partial [Mammaliicoccus vitulinus]|uniref:hypothetical protein n=1 Tax=Mammaliicoccus vitulinus TaxID=71237 RepID=UPI003F9D8279
YVACLVSLATFGPSMLLVWSVLQHTDVLCCLFSESCNFQCFYVACLVSLATFGPSMLLV